MNPKLIEFFETFRHLRSMQEIVEEILTLDYYVYNFVEESARYWIDKCITKYDYDIRRIGSLYKNKVVVDDDPNLYDEKDEQEINSDVQFIRDCLIIIGTVRSGLRQNIAEVVAEIKGE